MSAAAAKTAAVTASSSNRDDVDCLRSKMLTPNTKISVQMRQTLSVAGSGVALYLLALERDPSHRSIDDPQLVGVEIGVSQQRLHREPLDGRERLVR